MDVGSFNNNAHPPAPPQPPQFLTCSAVPGSPEWFTYWANEARETYEYNRRIADYGREMERWSRRVAGLEPEPEPETGTQSPPNQETQTLINQQEEFTSSESLQQNTGNIPVAAGTQTRNSIPPNATANETTASSVTMNTTVTLGGSNNSESRRNREIFGNSPYMDIFNELIYFPCEDMQDPYGEKISTQRYFSHEIVKENSNQNQRYFSHEIIKDDTIAIATNTEPQLRPQGSKIDGEKGIEIETRKTKTENFSQASNTRESVKGAMSINLSDLDKEKESIFSVALRENVEHFYTGAVKPLFHGMADLAVNIKDGVGGLLNEIMTNVQKISENRKPIRNHSVEKKLSGFHESYINSKWDEWDHYSQTGFDAAKLLSSEPSGLNSPREEQQSQNQKPQKVVTFSKSPAERDLPIKPQGVAAPIAQDLSTTPKFKAAMELGAFEINTWKEAPNGSTVSSGTNVRILCFNFKRFTNREGTRLAFDESCIDPGSLQVTPRFSEERSLLEVRASRNGSIEELTIFLPVDAIFNEIRIEKASPRYLSVTIPFVSQHSEMSRRNRHSCLLDELH